MSFVGKKARQTCIIAVIHPVFPIEDCQKNGSSSRAKLFSEYMGESLPVREKPI